MKNEKYIKNAGASEREINLMKQETHTQAAILVDIGDMEPNDPYCIIQNIYDGC